MKKEWAIGILVIAVLLVLVSITPKLIGFAINVSGLCTETDNGKDYYNQGTSAIGTTIKGTDYCINSNLLKEYSCSEIALKLDVTFHNCSGQCQNGACVVEGPVIDQETTIDKNANNIPWTTIIVVIVLIGVLYIIFVANKKGILRGTRKTSGRAKRKPSRKRR